MSPISPIIRRKVEAADRIYFNAVDLFHTTGHYAERRELPEDADKAKELVKKIAEDVRVLYGPEDPTEIEEAPCEEKKAKERETITQPALAQIWAATLQAATQYVGNPANLAASLMDAYEIIYGRSPDASAPREESGSTQRGSEPSHEPSRQDRTDPCCAGLEVRDGRI